MLFLNKSKKIFFFFTLLLSCLLILKVDFHNIKLVIIDSTLPDINRLIDNIPQDYQTYIIDSSQPFDQLNSVILQFDRIDEIHIISHGTAGKILLGSQNIDYIFLQKNRDLINQWKNKFSANSQLYLYGCNIAAGDKGKSFVQQFSNFLNINIFASTNFSGYGKDNYDWHLEYSSKHTAGDQLFENINPKFYPHSLTILQVTNNRDDGSPGSLREVINNLGSANDTIIFSGLNYPDTIRLTQGQIDVIIPFTILGPGADSLSISGENQSRIFNFSESGAKIHNLSMINGYTYGFSSGGAIYLSSTDYLYLFDCILSDNEAIGDSLQLSSAGLGGAIYNQGQLYITRCSIINNRSTGGFGNDGYGGAICQASGSTEINNSTFSGNTVLGGPATVGMNSGIGGAIANQSGNMIIVSSTIANNMAVDGAGGGVFNFGAGFIDVNNSIIGNNNSTADLDVSGIFNSLGYNLISDIGSSTGWTAIDILGQNPNIFPLRNNGGKTPTHALFPSSPALDTGDSTLTDSTDQRGFSRIEDGNGDDIAIIDIGSFEAMVPEKPTSLVAVHGDRSVELQWQYLNILEIAQFNIYRDSTLVANVLTPITTYNDSNLVNGQTYRYNVTAVDTIGFESSFSLPDSATPNGPPQWTFPGNAVSFDEDDSLIVDLDDFLVDDSDPDSLLTIGYTLGSFIQISIDPVTHVGIFSSPLNWFGIDTVILTATDPEGLSSAESIEITVNPVNDPPVLMSIPDTTILTYTNFDYQVEAIDVDNDSLAFIDNTSLFNIDSTGLISFRPTIQDTGLYEITIFVTDFNTVLRDTFLLDIQLSTINPPQIDSVEASDQALTFYWNNPGNPLYTGTRLYIQKDSPVSLPDSGDLVLDSAFVNAGDVSFTVSSLDIAANYYYLLFNFYQENEDIILSDFITGSDTTLAPTVLVDLSSRYFDVINGINYDTSIVVTNDGGGTLIGKFSYSPNAIQRTWFSMDSTLKIIPPYSSLNVPLNINIPSLITDTLLNINVSLMTNQPDWEEQSIEINVRNFFDRFAPLVTMTAEPDSIVKQAAVRFAFTANDTANGQIGDFPENLYTRYALYNNSTNSLVDSANGLRTKEIKIYPLKDGDYEFFLWVYDRSGNGSATLNPIERKNFIVLASQKIIPGRTWVLGSIPRDQNFIINPANTDSNIIAFRWNPARNDYQRVTSNSLTAGWGYWLFTSRLFRINLNNIPFGTNQDSINVPIRTGWNQIGTPMPYFADLNKVRLVQGNNSQTTGIPLSQAIADSLIDRTIYWYNSKSNQLGYDWNWIDSTLTEPWRGYWIFSNVSGKLVFPKEPAFKSTDTNQTTNSNLLADEWEINLSLQGNNYRDSKNIIGSSLFKNWKIAEPPIMDRYVSMYFGSPENKITGIYNPPLIDNKEIKQYNLYLETSEINSTHIINWQLPENNVFFYLVDNTLEKIINLREESSYSFTPSKKFSQMTLYVTYNSSFKPDIIPLSFKLKQNYPNPFNPVTTIEFGIPENGIDNITTLKIYNVLGQEISTLVNRKLSAGYHKIHWNGVNKNNQKVSSGLYFYSLSNGKTELFKKMIFIK